MVLYIYCVFYFLQLCLPKASYREHAGVCANSTSHSQRLYSSACPGIPGTQTPSDIRATLTAHTTLPKDTKNPEAAGETAPAASSGSPQRLCWDFSESKSFGRKQPGRTHTQHRGPDAAGSGPRGLRGLGLAWRGGQWWSRLLGL